MMTFGTRLFTWFRGALVGQDEFGNRYYTLRKAVKGRRTTRWVAYRGLPEPSKVPPEWHAWLHYTIADAPGKGTSFPHYRWEKEHLPNLTGTVEAYVPPGHIRRGADRAPSTSDYLPWTPAETGDSA